MRSLQSGPVYLPSEPMICSTEAFVIRKDYELPIVPVVSDKKEQDMLFRTWTVDALARYPDLLKSYDLLRGCWDTYATPKPKQ